MTIIESDKLLIIELFARRQLDYDAEAVARLTGSTAEEIAAAVEAGNLESQQHRGTPLFPWEEVATFALRRWTPRMIADALGSAHADALPSLNHMATLEVRLPLYQVELLRFLARRRGDGFRAPLSESDVLEQQLVDLANSVDEQNVEETVPGFRAAVQYPYQDT